MERLTKADFKDAPVTYRGCDLVGELHNLGYRTMAVYVEEILKRLSEYEDSGFTPEEVACMAQLKSAGRMKLMPCAVGDTVYVIRTRYKKRKWGDLMYDYAVHTSPERLRRFPDTCYVGEKICTETDMRFIGKTVFTTKEEALAKIEEAKANARCLANE